MKFILLLCFFLLLSSCAQNTSQNTKDLISPNIQPTISEFEKAEKVKRSEKAKQDLITGMKEVSRKFRIPLLESQDTANEDLIVRIWRFSAFADKDLIFILQRKNVLWSAYLMQKIVKNENDIKGALVEIKTTELGKPKSGWESFWLRLNNAEILNLPGEDENVPCPDCWLYTVETKVDGKYQVYDVNAPEINTDSHKSRKMIKVIEIISEEFSRDDFDIDNFQKP
jgi:hypothetical protein